MTLATVLTRAQLGVAAPSVTVEVHLANGLPSVTVVGLPDTEVREARDRVRAALASSGYDFPLRRITINLAPADLPKSGSRFDLPIALALLAASGQVPSSKLSSYDVVGELGLDGSVRPIAGVLPAALSAKAEGRGLVIPAANAAEAGVIDGLVYTPVAHLRDAVAWLRGETPAVPPLPSQQVAPVAVADLAEVKGQAAAKRALEVAAAGGHSLLFFGPPGTGKSMLAQRLPGLLPPLSDSEALECAAIHSLTGCFNPATWRQRPFRAPHHSASLAAIIGGGQKVLLPGEIALAHHGILFLDELPEFRREVLEALREPLENGEITVARLHQRVTFPARFQLVAAMNPCPCGFLGDPSGRCQCAPSAIARYQSKLSGAVLDRIDLMVEVPRLPAETLLAAAAGESTAVVKARVTAAIERQLARQGRRNAELRAAELVEVALLTAEAQRLLAEASQRLHLSARSHHRLLRVARTIADLDGAAQIASGHLAEAIQLRRTPWSFSASPH